MTSISGEIFNSLIMLINFDFVSSESGGSSDSPVMKADISCS